MTSPDGTVVTPLELLRHREESWSTRLSATRISLVAEDVKTLSEHSEQALQALGRAWRRDGTHTSRLLRRFPAVHVLTTTRVATDHYAASFWPKLIELAGLPQGQGLQQAWGEAYLANLQRLGLPAFEEVEDRGSRFVGPILMHSGVPTFCLPDLLRLVRDRRRLTQGLSPESFVSWARERARQDRLGYVDKPVQRFLRYGDEFAVDVVDRVFELLDVVAAGGTGDSVELPQRFIQAAVDLRSAGGPLSPAPTGTGDHAASTSGPAMLRLDPHGRGPFVRLPSIPDADEGQVVWVVGADAHEERVASLALLPGYHEPSPHVDVPINRPVRQVTARLEGSAHLDLAVPVVDGERPVLLFDEDGTQLSATSPLRRGAVWVVHPAETHELVSPAEDKIITESVLPPGWTGWRLLLVDLDGVTQLRLADGTSVDVQARAVPRIVMPAPVTGIRTMSGEPVFDQLPRIELPDLGEEGPTWSVSLVDDSGTVLVRRDMSRTEDCDRIWDAAPTAICGGVALRIRGPWGRTASRRFALVHGLSVRATPQWRRMTSRGLVPASVQLSTSSGIRCSASSIELTPSETRQVISVSTGTEKFPLVVEPPHMSVSHLTQSSTSHESVFALRLQAEAVHEDPGVLIVNTGAQASPRLHVLTREGPVQAIEPQVSAAQHQVYRFPLTQLTDTLRTEQQLQLALDPQGELTLAYLRPGRLFSDITIEAGVLHLSDAPDIEGLTAICYRSMAPWTEPVAVHVSNGCASLPEEFVDAGPLLVHVRIEDPWVPDPVPSWPRKLLLVEQPGYLTSGGDHHQVALSALLAGADNFDTYEADLSHVWQSYDRLWRLGLGERARAIDVQLRSFLADRPSEAMVALARTTIEPERIAHLLVKTGLAAQTIDEGQSDVPALRRANVLPLTLLGRWAHDEDSMDELVTVCGEVIRELATGSDPFASVGRFDKTSDVLAKMPESQRKATYRSAGLVPVGLLDANSRALAAGAVLEGRESERLRWLKSNVMRLNTEVRESFQVLHFRPAIKAMDARHRPDRPYGWRAIPEWSIGMAFACRLAAHRGLRIPVVETNIRALTDLAIEAPDLVAIDLMIAEFSVRHALTQQEPK